jgi:hypothetical protein
VSLCPSWALVLTRALVPGVLGEGGGGAATDGNGAGATECDGGSPGSAHEPGDAVEGGGDSAGTGAVAGPFSFPLL